MGKSVLTEEIKQWIIEHGQYLSGQQLAEMFGCTNSPINKWRRENGLSLSREEIVKHRSQANIGRTTFTEEEDNYIKKHYLTKTIGEIEKKLGRSSTGIQGRMKYMGLVIPVEVLEKRKSMFWIQKGDIPMNKGKNQIDYMTPEAIARTVATRFKKGNIPHNTNYDGHERISKDGYVEIRVRLGKYVLKHNVVWERENGKVPKGYCIWFKDGDRQNIELENLELITRAENLRRNQEGFRSLPPEIQEAQGLINKINR